MMKRRTFKLAAALSAAVFLCLAGLFGGALLFPKERALAAQTETEDTLPPRERACVSTAESLSAYDFTIESYETEMNVSENRTVEVREIITASFTGYDSHGIIRDFPLDSGVRYRDLKAECSNKDFSPYIQSDDSAFLSLYLRGEGIVKGLTRTYTISYSMELPAGAEGYLPLDVLGFGWQTSIKKFFARVNVPEGLSQYVVYSGRQSSKTDAVGVNLTRDGNTFLLSASDLGYEEGVTLDLQFQSGVLKGNFDLSILYALLLGAGLFGAALLVKLIFCRQPLMTVTVNLEPPEGMDPLLMGKLIDNKVDNEDLGALVFYLADKGCLTIDLTQEDDPALRVTGKSLPAGTTGYVRTFYDGLFLNRETVRMSELNNHFYMTAQSAKAGAELAAGQLYSTRSFALLIIFGIVCALLSGGLIFLCNLLFVGLGYRYFLGFAASAIAVFVSAAGNLLAAQRIKKLGKGMCALISVGFGLLGLLPTLLYLMFPCAGTTLWTGFVSVLFSSLAGGIAGRFITRTNAYSEKLGQILGFKQFILFTERDKIEFMLKEDPALYYHVLPYAQVLGVTDAWTEKFKGLDMSPPAYAEGAAFRMDVFDVILLNSLFRSMTADMVRSFVSRPSSSGGGFHGGSFGGGFGGGGFGGGGGRGC